MLVPFPYLSKVWGGEGRVCVEEERPRTMKTAQESFWSVGLMDCKQLPGAGRNVLLLELEEHSYCRLKKEPFSGFTSQRRRL